MFSSRVVREYVGYAGLLLTGFALIMLFSANLVLGLATALFVALVLAWYLRAKWRGEAYLKALAERMGGRLEGGRLGYGRVVAVRGGRRVEVSVNSGYDSARGLAGLGVSVVLLDSMMGVLAGIKNYTCVRVWHRARVETPFRLGERTFVDKHSIIHFPYSHGTTGLPKCSVEALLAEIDEMIEKASYLESRLGLRSGVSRS